jgi:hypothetical protein
MVALCSSPGRNHPGELPDNLNNHILPMLGDKKVDEIRPRLVAAFLQHLPEQTGMAPATVRKVRTVLSAVMSFAVAMEYADSKPVMKVAPPAGRD